MAEKLITVASFNEPTMAHVAQIQLEAEGIESYLDNENVVGMFWHYGNALGGVKVQVREGDAEAAQLILQGPQTNEGGEVAESSDEIAMQCPHCDSTDVVKEKSCWHMSVLIILVALVLMMLIAGTIWLIVIFMGIWMLQRKRWRCDACGHRWKARKRAFPG